MKILDEKGRIFTRINVIDFLIVLLIIGVFLTFYTKSLIAPPVDPTAIEKTESEDWVPVNITYTLKIRSVRTPTIDSLNESIGKQLLSASSGSKVGKLKSVEVSDATDFTVKNDGSYAVSVIPDKYDALLTVTVAGNENDDYILSKDDYPFVLGDTMAICTDTMQTSGEIVDITTQKRVTKKAKTKAK